MYKNVTFSTKSNFLFSTFIVDDINKSRLSTITILTKYRKLSGYAEHGMEEKIKEINQVENRIFEYGVQSIPLKKCVGDSINTFVE